MKAEELRPIVENELLRYVAAGGDVLAIDLRGRFGEALRMTRLAQRLSQAEVGERTGYTQASVWKVEQGLGSWAMIERLAEALGTSLADMAKEMLR